jgi:diaminohydroxyphosphoribosylaminopyrimidine deaminase/5-amino-6-(5-phosphoribosylamino)uracil reductase
MKQCLALAKRAFGKVAPNPMVGCVIVHNEKIIGCGYHKKFGGPHAEVNAINSVKNKNLLSHSVLYVNLEPCSHFGKTPPCADLIIKNGIKYVVIGTIDPNPLVKGRGINKLASFGCNLKIGILEDECRELNKRFYTFHEKKRPYIILKWAQTKDNYIGISKFRVQISNLKSQKLVHKWRSEEQAIMIGTNTALADNPELTVRKVKGKNPLRIVIDRELKIPHSYHLMDGSVFTLIFTEKKKVPKHNLEFIRIDFSKNVLKQVLDELYQRQIQSLIVEGGAKLLNSFIQENFWDEARVFIAEKSFSEIVKENKKAVAAPIINGNCICRKKIGSDLLEVYLPK